MRIIAVPVSVIDDLPGAVSTFQQGFDEKQGVTILDDLVTDQCFISAGTAVDSHMIFMNTLGYRLALDTNTWTFSGNILGTMGAIGNSNGSNTTNSSAILDAAGTTYPGGLTFYGLEGGDSVAVGFIGTNSLTVHMTVLEPGETGYAS